jgi:molybdopterin synthase catalytic subunit
MDLYRIQTNPITVDEFRPLVADPAAGAEACFLGVVRNEFGGRPSRGLRYEAYASLAEKEMARVGEELRREYGALHVVMVHRVGTLDIGEVSVLVMVSAPHRKDALAACQAGIDRLKARVPIFKQELWADGAEAWHGAPDGPPTG